MSLPDIFVDGDKDGNRGYMEWGFMSTTSDVHVAVKYSGAFGESAEEKPRAMVMEMRPNAVDRGACIIEFSQ